MTLDLCKAETGINTKDAEFERAKGEVRDKAKDLITQQKCFVREREQAIQTAEGLEEKLETAQSRIAQLEKEKVEAAEKTKMEMARMRLSRLREVTSERDRIMVAAARRFEKFSEVHGRPGQTRGEAFPLQPSFWDFAVDGYVRGVGYAGSEETERPLDC